MGVRQHPLRLPLTRSPYAGYAGTFTHAVGHMPPGFIVLAHTRLPRHYRTDMAMHTALNAASTYMQRRLHLPPKIPRHPRLVTHVPSVTPPPINSTTYRGVTRHRPHHPTCRAVVRIFPGPKASRTATGGRTEEHSGYKPVNNGWFDVRLTATVLREGTALLAEHASDCGGAGHAGGVLWRCMGTDCTNSAVHAWRIAYYSTTPLNGTRTLWTPLRTVAFGWRTSGR